MGYQIFTDATADLNEDLLFGLPNVEIIPMEILVGGAAYTYGPKGNITIGQFYKMLREGAYASTSQIRPETYRAHFVPYLEAGMDILYLGFTSGLSGTMNSAYLCARELQEEYPDRKILCVDTLCASVGEGLLVREALKRQADGMDMEELAMWATANCLDVCHWFSVDTFEHLKHGGRVSNVAAVAGSVLNIKPLLHVDEEGKLKVVEKPRGNKIALKAKLSRMAEGWNPEQGNLVIIGHGDCLERAEECKQKILEQHPEADVHIADIGPVIGSHTGPGVLAVIYWGNNR
ncbi:MAG: DegV family protein [Agathobacter sp.]|nr:DegV family protein [Agathobacter sp.]